MREDCEEKEGAVMRGDYEGKARAAMGCELWPWVEILRKDHVERTGAAMRCEEQQWEVRLYSVDHYMWGR